MDAERLTASRPRVAVLGAGGTIAMAPGQGAGVLPRLDADALLEAVPGLETVAEVTAGDLSVIPGPHMDLAGVIQIRDAADRAIAAGADGVVITQGTDTIEETAFALELLHADEAPVVVTGALRHPALPGADGPANLLDSVRIAADREAAGRGVLVVLNATVHAAARVTKAHTSRPDAFASSPGPLAEVSESRVLWAAPPAAQRATAAEACREPAPVALLAASLGDDGRLLPGLAAAGYQGLVIDALGGGHLPPLMAERLDAICAAMPVVVASRCRAGATLQETYAYPGGELDLARRGALTAGWLTAPKARVALSLLVGAGASRGEIREFLEAYGGG